MNKYIWLNPVILQMYNQEELSNHLVNLGFEMITVEENHLQIVKNKYKEQYKDCKRLLCDNRCPKAVSYVRSHYNDPNLEYSAIQPILIHCAEELANRYKDYDVELYIITPCTDLKDQGNKLNMKNTIFQTWTEFCRDHNIMINSKSIQNSPIPPGFFDNIPNVVSLSSKNDIDSYFQEVTQKDKRLIEMLYCPGGCHNGDGVKIANEKYD
ncbi:hypothetical protein [Bacillus massiliigorillae]|uniref:hypothetical protein n=1 Tax=Bacillus massiliigorillae TaxID=1243664 RepID=UPI000399E870|nr:hypothetical protein [Bacillus massiliigorillae]